MATKGSGLKSTSINGVKRQRNTAYWVGPKTHRPSRKDKDYQQKIELVQDLTFPTATSRIKVTPDGEFLIASDEVEDKQVEKENTDAETAISLEDSEEKTEEEREELPELEGIPIAPSAQTVKKPGVIFVLEKASLEVAKVGKNYQILNSEEHANFLRRNNKNPANCKPDITYQALLSILDSPLNKAGCLRAAYVKNR